MQRTYGSLRLRIGAPLPVDRAKGGRNDRQPPFYEPAPFRGLLAIRVCDCLPLPVSVPAQVAAPRLMGAPDGRSRNEGSLKQGVTNIATYATILILIYLFLLSN